MLEFGFLFDHTLTIQYASREGARVGSALVNRGGAPGCGTGQSPAAADVDKNIVAAVTRVLNSDGSRVNPAEVPTITIYHADSNGSQIADARQRLALRPGQRSVGGWAPDRLHARGRRHALAGLLADEHRLAARLDRHRHGLHLPLPDGPR